MAIAELNIPMSPSLKAKLAIQAIGEAIATLEQAHSCNPMAVEFYLIDMECAGYELGRVFLKVKNRQPSISTPEQGAGA